MISIKNLNKTYGKGTSKYQALKDINLELPETGFVCILGQSGSGKTTLMNIIGSLDSYDSGNLTFKGKEIKNFTEEQVAKYRSTDIGFIFQDYNVIEKLTVEENVNLALNVQGKSSLDKVHDYLDLVELKGLEKRKINELSGGQKQRVAIARALIKEPDILLCDEATGNVDSNTSAVISNIIKKISKEKLVIFITHDSDLATNYADRIISIKDGEIESDVDNKENSSKFNMKFTKSFGSNVSEEEVVDAIEHARQMSVELDISINPSSSAVSTDDMEVSKQLFNSETKKAKSAWKYFMSLAVDNIKQKKLRTAIIMVTFMMVLTITSVTRTISTYNPARDYVAIMEKTDELSYVLYKNNPSGADYWVTRYYSTGSYVYDEAAKSVGVENILTMYETEYRFAENTAASSYGSLLNYASMYSVSGSFDFTRYDFVGSAPSNKNEIVVTEAVARYLYGEDSNLNNYIGLTYNPYGFENAHVLTITGIVNTDYSGTYLDDYFKMGYDSNNYDMGILYSIRDSNSEAHLAIFTHEDFYDYQYNYDTSTYTSSNYTSDVYEEDIKYYANTQFYSNTAANYYDVLGSGIAANDEILIGTEVFNLYCFGSNWENYIYPSNATEFQNYIDTDVNIASCYNNIIGKNTNFSITDKGYADEDYMIKTNSYIDFDSIYPNGAKIVGITTHYNADYVVHDNVMIEIYEDTRFGDVYTRYVPTSNMRKQVESLVDSDFTIASNSNSSAFSSIEEATEMVDFFLTPKVVLILTIVLAIIPAFFLYLFNNISIDLKKKEIGILKSIGSSNNQVMSIFLLQAVLIGIISLIVAIIGTVLLTNIVASIVFRDAARYGVTGYSFTLDNFVYISVLTFIICTMSLLLPYIKFNRQAPINIVKDL